jgi:RNA polymerase sigma-70 factor (ECF subfamily)
MGPLRGRLLRRRTPVPSARVPAEADGELVARLRAKDEAAFMSVVDAWSPAMLRLARSYVSTHESAEEVVQETWIAVLRGLGAFEGRSSLRTWTFRILVNIAKTRGVKEQRVVPFSSAFPDADDAGPAVDPSAFRGAGDPHAGGWTDEAAPRRWQPEVSLLGKEIQLVLTTALERLPDRQRVVITLRDVEGCSPEEVCQILEISPENQRVLLHRARAKVRADLDAYYRQGGSS